MLSHVYCSFSVVVFQIINLQYKHKHTWMMHIHIVLYTTQYTHSAYILVRKDTHMHTCSPIPEVFLVLWNINQWHWDKEQCSRQQLSLLFSSVHVLKSNLLNKSEIFHNFARRKTRGHNFHRHRLKKRKKERCREVEIDILEKTTFILCTYYAHTYCNKWMITDETQSDRAWALGLKLYHHSFVLW